MSRGTPEYDQCPQGTPPGLSTGPVVVYGSEGTPLLPGRSQGRRPLLVHYGIRLGTLLALLLVGVNLFLHFYNCPLYPSTMDAIRREWGLEVAQHTIVREQWALEAQEHETVQEKWKLEVAQHTIVREQWALEAQEHETVQEKWKLEKEYHEKEEACRVRKENERQERARQEWETEAEEHRKEVARKARDEEERQERTREKWDREEQTHRHKWEEMQRWEDQRREKVRQRWRREVEEHDHLEEERKKRETEERQKLNLFWGSVKAHTCTTYATREYTAQLMNLPTTWEHRVEACKVTPLEVHGVSHLPKNCEDKGHGVILGRWEIDQREPDCTTFWNWYKDKGCTSPRSGKRRIEHYLENLPQGGDWREFCATTPASFNGMAFPGPHECFQYNLGTYGHWEIEDTSCQ